MRGCSIFIGTIEVIEVIINSHLENSIAKVKNKNFGK